MGRISIKVSWLVGLAITLLGISTAQTPPPSTYPGGDRAGQQHLLQPVLRLSRRNPQRRYRTHVIT